MSRRVQFEINFEVPDSLTEDDVNSIVTDAYVQISEAVLRREEDAWNVESIETTVLAYATTLDGEIIDTWERED